MEQNSSLPRAKKSLGQHFLVDDNICRKIVAAADIRPGDRVLEIGPGLGALTRFLDASGAGGLRLIEKDGALAAAAQERWPRAEVLEQDALTLAWDALAAEGPWRVLGNLPYNVASRIIWDMAPHLAGLRCAVFMVQLEVAERLRANPGGKQYGALGAWLQAFGRVRLLFQVGPHLFRPRPRVESAVVRIDPLPQRMHSAPVSRLAAIIRQAFQNRRKQLPGALGALWTPAMADAVERLGISNTIRPERLSSEVFWELAEAENPGR